MKRSLIWFLFSAAAWANVSDYNPKNKLSGSLDFTLVLTGDDFDPDEYVLWNGSRVPTHYVSSTELDATIGAALLGTPGAARVQYVTSDDEIREVGTVQILRPGSGAAPSQGTVGDPVATASGELYKEVAELSLNGPLPLNFKVYYGTLLSPNGFIGSLGTNWMHNFEARLRLIGDSAIVTLFENHRIDFALSGSVWKLATEEQLPYQFTGASSTGYQLFDPADKLIYSFSRTGDLTSIEDRNGNKLTVQPGPLGPLEVADGLGRRLVFTYSLTKLTRIDDQAGRSIVFGYTGDLLTSVTDADGKTTRYDYAAGSIAGLLASETLPNGDVPFRQTFDAQGRVLTQTDSRGNSTALQYDRPNTRYTTVTDPRGFSSQQFHQGPANLAFLIDPAGQQVAIAYDASNRRVTVRDRLGDATTAKYNPDAGYTDSITDAAGKITHFTYAPQTLGAFTFYNLTRIDFPDGTALSVSNDAEGNPLTITDQAGKRWTYQYNSRGQVQLAANPANGVTTYGYNPDATLKSIKSPAGDTTTFAYDDKKRLITIGNPDGTATSFAYDNRDNRVSQVLPNGKTQTAAFNDNNRITTVTRPGNSTTTLGYDSDQRPSSVKEPASTEATVKFDEAGLIKSITAPSGEVVNFTFTATNLPGTITDCTSKGFTFTYDNEHIFSSVKDGLGRTWNVASDQKGRITQVTSPLSRKFSFTYDSLGRLTAITNPLGRATSYQLDGRGRITGAALPGEITLGFGRNDLGSVSAVTTATGDIWSRSYDSSGRLTGLTDPVGRTISYAYNSRSRVSKVTLPDGTIDYSYDAAGFVTRIVHSDGLDLTFTRDDRGQVLSASGVSLGYDAFGSVVQSNGLAIGRDSNSRIVSVTYAAGKTVQYSYDCRGLLTQVNDWVGGNTKVVWDDARQLSSITRPNGVITQYTYDTDGRLVVITERGNSQLSLIALERDLAGNIITSTREGPLSVAPASGVRQLTYDAAGQVKGASYDGEGRPLTLAGRSYKWDLASRLASYKGPDGEASFAYDALGMRISRTVSGSTQNYVLNYGFELPTVSVIRDGSTDRRYYVHLPDGTLLYSIDAATNQRRFFHFDEAGSTIFLTDDSGAITDKYASTPYGEEFARSGTSDNPFTYLGAFGVLQEGNTGLFYNRARYYDSATARFLTRDPEQAAVAPEIYNANPYAYGAANPLVSLDAAGRGDWSLRVGARAEGGDFSRFVFSLRQAVAGGMGTGPEAAMKVLRLFVEATGTGSRE